MIVGKIVIIVIAVVAIFVLIYLVISAYRALKPRIARALEPKERQALREFDQELEWHEQIKVKDRVKRK